MKIEEAVKWMEEAIQETTECFEECSPALQKELVEQKEVFELALTALRSMSESGEYHFRDDTKLSLEQLKQMDGKPVWIEDTSCWGLVFIPKAGQFKNSPFVLFRKKGVQFEWQIEDSELTVYAYPPAHIDRSKWEGCDCDKPKSCCTCCSMRCQYCIKQSEYRQAAYCMKCGKPLTEEAWAELERRLRG